MNSKNLNNLLCLVSILLICFSCSDEDQPIGIWDDNIKLSTKSVEFTAEADSTIVTTKGNWWWINSVNVNDESYYNFYNNDEIDLVSDNYSISEDCFVIERRDKNTLFIKIDKNDSNEERIVRISLQAGNYFDGITITQAAN